MKILITCQFSSGICGVWSRVKADAKQYIKEGNQVQVFSSNAIKGESGTAPEEEIVDGIHIRRFGYKKLGGESFLLWSREWKKYALEYKPDLIVVHGYRQIYTTSALRLGKKLGCCVRLIGHAPFVEGDTTRSFLAKWIVRIYDRTYGKWTINKFDKVITITKWENKYWKKIGLKDEKICYIPNEVDKLFHTIPIGELGDRDVLFLGRVSPIKDIETLIRAAEKLPDVKFSIVGPVEDEYGMKLHEWIETAQLHNIEFYPAVFDVKEKIKIIDAHKIFVLPSKREAMPISLIEAFARKRIVITSDNPGCREIVENNKNGYLFPVGDFETLIKLIQMEVKK